MRIRFLLLFINILLFFQCASSQELNWTKIEDSISKKSNLLQLNRQLEQTKTYALQQKEYPLAARCYFHQMQIADLTTEDTLYFKNSRFIDSFLNIKELPLEMKSVMLILKAKRIAQFRERFARQTNKNLFFIPEETTDYTQLTSEQLDSLVQLNLKQAKKISFELPNEEVKKLLWLSTDPLLFLFKPDFTDIIFAEQLHYAAATSGYPDNNNKDFLRLTPDEFIKAKKPIAGLNNKQQAIFELYQQWANYHIQQKEIFYFIESLSR